MKNVAGSAEADASLGIIDADSGAGGVELVLCSFNSLGCRVGHPRGAEQYTMPVMDGWVDCLTDDYIGTPVKISVFFMRRRDKKQRN